MKARLGAAQTMQMLEPSVQKVVREAFAARFINQIQVFLGMNSADVIVLLLMIECKSLFQHWGFEGCGIA